MGLGSMACRVEGGFSEETGTRPEHGANRDDDVIELLPSNERYSFELRTVLSRAQQAAAADGAVALEPEHILAVFCEDDGTIGGSLVHLVVREGCRPPARQVAPTGAPEPKTVELACSPRTVALLTGAVRAARRWHQNFVGDEHVVLAMLEDENSGLARILRDRGLTPETARQTIVTVLGLR